MAAIGLALGLHLAQRRGGDGAVAPASSPAILSESGDHLLLEGGELLLLE